MSFGKAHGGLGGGSIEFNSPNHVVTDTEGNIFVIDSGNNCVQVFGRLPRQPK